MASHGLVERHLMNESSTIDEECSMDNESEDSEKIDISLCDESSMIAELTSAQKMMVDKIKRKMQCDGRTVKFTRSFFESLKSISLEDIQNFLDPKPGHFLEEIEKDKEYTIINRTIELEYRIGEDQGIRKMAFTPPI